MLLHTPVSGFIDLLGFKVSISTNTNKYQYHKYQPPYKDKSVEVTE